MILNDRHISVMLFLLKFRYAFQSQIKHEFFKNLTAQACSKALRKLIILKLIVSEYVPRSKQYCLGNILYLTDKGANLLAEEYKTTAFELGYRKIARTPRSLNALYHRKRIIDINIQICKETQNLPLEISYLVRDDQRVKGVYGQEVITTMYSHDRNVKIVPDMVLILKNPTTHIQAIYVIEIDTGKEIVGGSKKYISENSVLEKFEKYQRLLLDRDRGWKEKLPSTKADGFRVLFVTESQRRITTIQNQSFRFDVPEYFLFSTFEKLEENGFFNASWLNMNLDSNWQTVV